MTLRLVKIILIFFVMITGIYCNHSREAIVDNRIPFNFPGMLRIDGYYQRIDSISNNIEIFIFFKNGKLLQGYFRSEEELKIYFSSNKILLESKYALGSFNYQDEIIILKYYIPVAGNELSSRWDIYTEEGKIIDENTLLFTKGYRKNHSIFFNHIYKFRKENIPELKLKNE